MPSLGESLQEAVSQKQVPPQDWFSLDFQPLVAESIRKVYLAFRIDPAALYKYQKYLGRNNVRQGNICLWLLAALADAAQEELERQAREDQAVELPEGSPFQALHDRGGLPDYPFAQAGNEPTWQTNSAFQANPDSRFRSAQGRPELDNASAPTAAQVANGVRQNAQTDGVIPIDSETSNSAGPRADAFEANLAAKDSVFQARRQRQLLPAAEVPSRQQEGETINPILFGSVSKDAGELPPGVAVPRTVEGRPEAPGESRQDIAVLTPLRRPRRTHSSPHLSADAGAVSAASIGKIKESERKHIESMKLSFAVNGYLEDFITWAAKVLQRALHLDAGEKAELLLPMLQDSVKERLVGRQILVNPESPEQIFAELRHEFPPRHDQLLIDLTECAMAQNESATAFIHRAQAIFVKNQVPLPTTQSKMMAVYMKGTASFIKHCRDSCHMRQTLLQGLGAERDPGMTWDHLQNLAREYDSSRALMNGVYKGRSSEVSKLGSGQIRESRTRSGRTLAIAEPAASQERGRPQQRDEHERRDRTRTPGSARSADSNRSWKSSGGTAYRGHRSPHGDRSPRTPMGPAGHTPFRKTPVTGPPMTSRPPVSSVNLSSGINYIEMNLVSALKVQQIESLDANPIVFSTLPGHCLKDETASVSVNAAAAGHSSKRPNLPEGIAQEDLDRDNEPLNLPEAMRRGLRKIQDLPVQNPYAKILNAQFMLTFRQLAGLCLDDEFASICQMLIQASLRKEQRQELTATTVSAVDILQMAIRELPICRMHADAQPMNIPGSDDICCAVAGPSRQLTMSVIHMVELPALLDDNSTQRRLFRLDSGAAISCISQEAFARDRKWLLSHGTLHRLLTPMTLSGFAAAHSKVDMVLEGVKFRVGNARYEHNFLIVPRLVCGYLVGQDFMVAYDVAIMLSKKVAVIGVPPEEWVGATSYVPYQDIDVGFVKETAVLEVGAS